MGKGAIPENTEYLDKEAERLGKIVYSIEQKHLGLGKDIVALIRDSNCGEPHEQRYLLNQTLRVCEKLKKE